MNAYDIEIQLKKEMLQKRDGKIVPIYTGAIYHKGQEVMKVKGFINKGQPDKKDRPTDFFKLEEDVQNGKLIGSFNITQYTGENKEGGNWEYHKCHCYNVNVRNLCLPMATERLWQSVELEFLVLKIDQWAVDTFTDKEYVLGAEESIPDSSPF
ncbi:MAG: hypothetical protein O3C19_06775 [Bacteroidetes bacterium]|nr:hypothetical protein [Bacteroidota bacterium]